MRDVAAALKAKVGSGRREGALAAPRTPYRDRMLTTPLKQLAPTAPRTPDAYRRTMLRFAETLEKVLPCKPEADDVCVNATDEVVM